VPHIHRNEPESAGTYAQRLTDAAAMRCSCFQNAKRRDQGITASHSVTRAGDRTRTGDVQLGKLAFYQLNYAREVLALTTTYQLSHSVKRRSVGIWCRY
jgi:hypothetical protein